MDAFLSSLGREGTHCQAGGTRKPRDLPTKAGINLTARKGGSASETAA